MRLLQLTVKQIQQSDLLHPCVDLTLLGSATSACMQMISGDCSVLRKQLYWSLDSHRLDALWCCSGRMIALPI